jgi:hypothetical protein
MNNRQIIDNLSTRIAKRRGHQYWLVRISRRFLSGNANTADYADALEQCLRDDIKKFPKFEDNLLRLGYFAVFCLFAIGTLATLLSYL